MLKIRKIMHRTTYSITADDGSEVEVQFEPCDWTETHCARVGDKLVVAYLSLDGTGSSNPMTEFDGQGKLYTKPSNYGSGVITDDMGSLLSALQLNGENEVHPDVRFEINGHVDSLEGHAVTAFMAENFGHALTDEWRFETGLEVSEDEDRSIHSSDEIETAILNGEFKYDEHQALMLTLYAKHWREIVGPFVVPVSWCSNNHGPGTASASVTSWDGDADDLPDAVWVADAIAIDNSSSSLPLNVHVKYSYHEKCWRVLHEVPGGVNTKFDDRGEAIKFARSLGPGDIAWQAKLYCAAILEEYVNWCNGDVYGCCVETFKKIGEDDDAWESISSDECWGFIGSEYAEQALLDDYFNPAVAAIKEAA